MATPATKDSDTKTTAPQALGDISAPATVTEPLPAELPKPPTPKDQQAPSPTPADPAQEDPRRGKEDSDDEQLATALAHLDRVHGLGEVAALVRQVAVRDLLEEDVRMLGVLGLICKRLGQADNAAHIDAAIKALN